MYPARVGTELTQLNFRKQKKKRFGSEAKESPRREVHASATSPCTETLRACGNPLLLSTAAAREHKTGAPDLPWRLCTVTRVEELKSVVRLLPIWASGIVFATRGVRPDL
jgi:hypothetical protein